MRNIAVLLILLAAATTPLCAQNTDVPAAGVDTQPPYRDPVVARVFGIAIPGAGHVYAGEYLRGVQYYYGTVCGIGGGAIALAVSGMGTDKAPAWPLQVGGVLAIGLGVGVWVRSALDAPRAAERANRKRKAAVTHVSLMLQPGTVAGSGTKIGLAVSW